MHKKRGDLLTTKIDKQEQITNDFNNGLQKQIKIASTVEQLMGAEIRQRTEGLRADELRKMADKSPSITKALNNDPLSKLSHPDRTRMIDTFPASL